MAGSVGPLLEDDNLVLTCEVRGGKLYDNDLVDCNVVHNLI